MRIDPEKVYGSVPESFSHRVAYALRQCEKEETKTMKRKPVAAMMITILLLTLTTTAVAAVLSRTTEFFVFEYGERYREKMESGVVAPVGQSTVLNGVTFTLDDAVIIQNKRPSLPVHFLYCRHCGLRIVDSCGVLSCGTCLIVFEVRHVYLHKTIQHFECFNTLIA